jgi:hypothetical protein
MDVPFIQGSCIARKPIPVALNECFSYAESQLRKGFIFDLDGASKRICAPFE